MPRLPQKRPKKKNNSGTAIALIGMLFASGGLFGMAAMVLGPGAVAIVGIGVLLAFFIAFHYLLWGRWLMGRLNRDNDSDRQSE